MKHTNRGKLVGSCIAALLLAFTGMSAQAANTAAGTDITNTAQVDYKVNNVPQTQKPSNTASFKVDHKIVLTVVQNDSTFVAATPGSTTAILSFTVTNTGNSPQGAVLTAANLSGSINPFGSSVSDNFDPSAFTVYVDNPVAGGGSVVGSYDSTDTATSIAELTANGSSSDSATVFIVATIPSSQVNNDIAGMSLVADVRAPGTPGYGNAPGGTITDDSGTAWTVGGGSNGDGTYNIFADAANADVSGDALHDGKASDIDAFKVQTATLAITKTAAVITDPVACTTAGVASSCGANEPHAIPGAVVEYTIKVDNSSGAADATDVNVSDSLDTEIGSGSIAYDTGSMGLTIGGSAEATCTDATGDDKCAYNSGTHVVTAGTFTVQATKTAELTFRVTIQ